MARWRRRRYRRRRYRRRGRVPKAIGTSNRNFMKACFNIEQGYIGRVPFGDTYMQQQIVISPLISRMIPKAMTAGYDQFYTFAGLFNSESFRKFMTMYQNFKIDGVYVQVQITPASDAGVYTIYGVWDRHGDRGARTKYVDNYPGLYQGKIKANANEQGGKMRTLYPEKGYASWYTKCLPLTTPEKTGWIDANTEHGTEAVTGVSSTVNHYFRNSMWVGNNLVAAFSPQLYVAIERSTPGVEGGSVVHIQTKMRVYCSFKNPGMSETNYATVQQLLENNEQLLPYNTSTGTKVVESDEWAEEAARANKRLREIAADDPTVEKIPRTEDIDVSM